MVLLFFLSDFHVRMKLNEAFAGLCKFPNLHLFDVLFDFLDVFLKALITFFVKLLVVLNGDLATAISLFVDRFEPILPHERLFLLHRIVPLYTRLVFALF
jgi:hypothetical protein